ncbi:MAG: L-threonylcarbamoyladenylate synthase [Candidatus Dormibacteria bacterium]
MSELVVPEGEGLQRLMRALEGGGLVAFPTDTVYALACAATDPAAVTRFYTAKQRPPGQPAILLSHNLGTLQHWVKFKPRALALAEEHWPGPLTMVLPLNHRALARLPVAQRSALAAIAHDDAIATRIPDHHLANDVLWAWGMPLCTASANRAGEPPPRTGPECVAALVDSEVLVLDGECPLGQPSSILDMTSRPPRVLREGAIPAERLLS